VANAIGDIHTRREEALRSLRVDYKVSVKSSSASLSTASG
jgi:hypothetical protein